MAGLHEHEIPAHGEHGAPHDHAGHAGHAAPTGDTRHAEHDGGRHAGHSVADFRRRFWVCLALTVPVIALSPELPFVPMGRLIDVPGADWILLALSTLIYVYGGRPFLLGLVRELRQRRPGMMTLVAVAITVAYVYSAATVLGLEGMPFFWELATLVDIMLLGHWIEMRSVGEASKALEELARLLPGEAHLIAEDGSTTDVEPESLQVGDRVLVRPGERLPADGLVAIGDSSVDEALLTGESAPVSKHPGDEVIGGSINGQGALHVDVTRTGAESFLAQVMELVRQAQESTSQTQDLADRAALWLTLLALSGGVLTFAVWLVLAEEPLAFAMERAVTVMVITCPHALGLAIPLVVAISTALGASSGVLVRERMAFERARLLDTVIFDKTGTLTEGRFGVAEATGFGGFSAEEALSLASAVEALSEHPIARAITQAAPTRRTARDFRALPGRGVQARVDGHDVAVLSPQAVAGTGVVLPPEAVASAGSGRTMVAVLVDGALAGVVTLADVVRPESADAVSRLKAMGIESIMLTGDAEAVAARVAGELGIERVFAGVLPAEKSDVVKQVRAEGRAVAMVGDGVNDAPALAEADVGIAIGAGTDVAVATADVVLVKSDPRDVVSAIELSRATYRKMVQNLAWATGYNLVAIPLAAGVLYDSGILLSPAVGAVLMSASTVIVAVNARLLRVTR